MLLFVLFFFCFGLVVSIAAIMIKLFCVYDAEYG